ncbi:DUF2510 domain-containing protein [Demequina sp. NBRC 110056]|uniref:DUF2510 domain-containing protein n=1 Tax=Demequina sp. NBRC 110056 TaxID=1570345 RepID=UPI000A06DB51|nr:DUF2510 domain-containing protein [Demequina sp. NBRC 110056]
MTHDGTQPSHSGAPRLPPAGWLPDPAHTDLERFWDGARWTGRTRDRFTRVESPPPVSLAYEPRTWSPEPAHRRSRPRKSFSIGRVLGATVAIITLSGVGYMYAADAGYVEPLIPAAAQPAGPVATVPTQPAPSARPTVAPAATPVDYPLHGSNELVRHLEAALIAQEPEIDVSFWGFEVGADGIIDAMHEALTQSPYAYSTAWEVMTLGEAMTVVPDYTYDDAEAERRRSATRQAGADALVASGAHDADDPVERVTLIHDWIVDNATYDMGVFEAVEAGERSPRVDQSQEAYGILVMGTAVCTGYAKAFTVMAEQAGLDTILITGSDTAGATGGNHAWNKVLIDGEWLLVDTTWDDPIAPEPVLRHDYLLVEDGDPILDSRTTDAGWIVDASLGDYGA